MKETVDDRTPATIHQFFESKKQRLYSKGEIILRPGESPSSVIYIKSGFIKQYDISPNGQQVVVNTFKPGSFLPIFWVLNDEKNFWYFEAETDIEARISSKTSVLDYLSKSNEQLMRLMKRLVSGATGQQRRMAHLMGGTARSRVLFELIVEFKRFGSDADGGFIIRSSEADIAAKAGLSREAVNRVLAKLKKENMIKRGYRSIQVDKIEILEMALGYDV